MAMLANEVLHHALRDYDSRAGARLIGHCKWPKHQTDVYFQCTSRNAIIPCSRLFTMQWPAFVATSGLSEGSRSPALDSLWESGLNRFMVCDELLPVLKI